MEASIKIKVHTEFVEQESNPKEDKYLFSYTVTIENHGTTSAKLQSRHWVITDANGKKSEIQGSGVVGETPTIAPNTSYKYTSGALLETPVGVMQGCYQMLTEKGDNFKAVIPAFRLAVPGLVH